MKVVANRRNARGPRAVPGSAGTPLPAVAGHLAAQAEHAIERADAKAATLAATATAILAFAVQGGSPCGCGGEPAATVALALAALCWIAGIFALAAAIFPRFEDSGDQRLTFFNHFPSRFDAASLRALAREAGTDPERWLLAQAHALSRIAVTKYRFIRLGMWLLGAGAALALSGVLLR
jgi:hypothetical protein